MIYARLIETTQNYDTPREFFEDTLNDGYDRVLTCRGRKVCETRTAARRTLKQCTDLVRQIAADLYELFEAYDVSSRTLSGTSPSSKISLFSASNANVSTISGQLHARVSGLTADAFIYASDDTHLLAHINDIFIHTRLPDFLDRLCENLRDCVHIHSKVILKI